MSDLPPHPTPPPGRRARKMGGDPKNLQPPPEEAKMGAVLNNVLGRSHEEETCHLINIVDRRWV